MEIPNELSKISTNSHLLNYPKILIPQSFSDERRTIKNIVDRRLDDVAIISSKANSIRANHVHNNDWHLSYVVSGSMKYFWKSDIKDNQIQSILVEDRELVYTPKEAQHSMQLLEDWIFIAISRLSRVQEYYAEDSKKLPDNFFT
jgi:dTDP-4-dehydrorhamnose 3,5-epimerase-like enzyme